MKLQPALDALGWRRVDLARRLGVSPETISRWGEVPPRYVQAYLGAMLAVQEIRQKAERLLS